MPFRRRWHDEGTTPLSSGRMVGADDFGQAVVVDVADRRGDRVVHVGLDLEVHGSGLAVEHVDVADLVGPALGRGGHHDHVGDVTQVDDLVVVVVGHIGHQRRDDAVDVGAVPLPDPLDVGLEAVGRGPLTALGGRVELVLGHGALV